MIPMNSLSLAMKQKLINSPITDSSLWCQIFVCRVEKLKVETELVFFPEFILIIVLMTVFSKTRIDNSTGLLEFGCILALMQFLKVISLKNWVLRLVIVYIYIYIHTYIYISIYIYIYIFIYNIIYYIYYIYLLYYI